MTKGRMLSSGRGGGAEYVIREQRAIRIEGARRTLLIAIVGDKAVLYGGFKGVLGGYASSSVEVLAPVSSRSICSMLGKLVCNSGGSVKPRKSKR